MNSSSCVLLFVLFSNLINLASSHYFYDSVKMYGCRCLQKDKSGSALSVLTNKIPPSRPIWRSAPDSPTPTVTSNIQSKIEFLKRWLSNLTLDSPVPPTTTTTTKRPITMDPVALPYDEGTGSNNNSMFMRLAYKIMAKYFKKFRGEWSILDRFECVCDGNLIELLKSKTFINIQIAHD